MKDWRQQLESRCAGRVLEAPVELAARARDFGGMYQQTPRAVLQPACVEDVQAAVRIARDYAVPLTVRGAGHSQSGQGLGTGLVLDMTSLQRILSIDSAERTVEVEAGVCWRAVVDATYRDGLLPIALTHAMDTSVAGTLSVGGVGAESLAYGPQVDNVRYLDVVTGTGDLVRCGPDRDRELFDAVRAGLGQCGVIVRAGYPLRAGGRYMKTRAFVYREMPDLLVALRTLVAEPAAGRLLAVRLGQDPLRRDCLIAVLFLGHERAQRDAVDEPLPQLRHVFEPPSQLTPTWTEDGLPGHPFFRLFATTSTSAMHRNKNAWVDTLFEPDAFSAALETLASNPHHVLAHGPAEIIPVRRGVCPAPLFVVPHAELSLGLGMYASFPEAQHEQAAVIMEAYAHQVTSLGGKRYLAGYFGTTTSADWERHYGSQWERFCRAKTAWDPAGVFASGLIHWPLPASGTADDSRIPV